MLHSRSPRGQRTRLTEQEARPARETALERGSRVWAEIDFDQLASNVASLKQAAAGSRLLVSVKANAYGHGAVPCARSAIEAGADFLGVACVEEGEELRRAGIKAPILVLSSTPAGMADRAIASDLRLVVGSFEQAQALSRAAQARGATAQLHIKVETGMNRFGAPAEEAPQLANAMRELPAVEVEGLSSHLAASDDQDKTFTRRQFERFQACARQLDWIPIHHIANTGAVLDLPDLHLNMVRCGIGVYGYYPSDHIQRQVKLTPVMALRSRVARVETIEAGEGVGYGLAWRAPKRSRIALVLAGYGDGIRRSLSNKGIALVRGQRASYAGRVAMDMIALDVSHIPGVLLDDEVTLLGPQGSGSVDANELAELAGTISYEVLTGVMQRVTRFYSSAGRVVAVQDLAGLHDEH
jgi:alanine racemase